MSERPWFDPRLLESPLAPQLRSENPEVGKQQLRKHKITRLRDGESHVHHPNLQRLHWCCAKQSQKLHEYDALESRCGLSCVRGREKQGKPPFKWKSLRIQGQTARTPGNVRINTCTVCCSSSERPTSGKINGRIYRCHIQSVGLMAHLIHFNGM